MFGGEHRHPFRDGHRFNPVVRRNRVGLRQAMEEVGPHLRGLTPSFRCAEAGEREGEVGRRLFFVAQRQAFGRAFRQVVGFVYDEYRIMDIPPGHGLEGGAVAGREDVVVVADDDVGVREHRLGDIPRRHARDAADLADPTEVGGFLQEMLRVNLCVGPVAPDLLGVIGDAFHFVFRAWAEEHRAQFVAAGESAEFGEDLDLASALAGKVEQTSCAAAAEEAESVA